MRKGILPGRYLYRRGKNTARSAAHRSSPARAERLALYERLMKEIVSLDSVTVGDISRLNRIFQLLAESGSSGFPSSWRGKAFSSGTSPFRPQIPHKSWTGISDPLLDAELGSPWTAEDPLLR